MGRAKFRVLVAEKSTYFQFVLSEKQWFFDENRGISSGQPVVIKKSEKKLRPKGSERFFQNFSAKTRSTTSIRSKIRGNFAKKLKNICFLTEFQKSKSLSSPWTQERFSENRLKNLLFVENHLKFCFFLPSSPSRLTKSNKTVVSARVSPRRVRIIFREIFCFS